MPAEWSPRQRSVLGERGSPPGCRFRWPGERLVAEPIQRCAASRAWKGSSATDAPSAADYASSRAPSVRAPTWDPSDEGLAFHWPDPLASRSIRDDLRMEDHRGAGSAVGAAIMTLAGGGAVAWLLAAATPGNHLPGWPVWPLVIVAFVGGYVMVRSSGRWSPWRVTVTQISPRAADASGQPRGSDEDKRVAVFTAQEEIENFRRRGSAPTDPLPGVSIGSLEAQPAPRQREGQIVVGELPGAPPAFVEREAVDRLAAAFEAGGGVAVVSALTGQRGAGKTQVAAAYARQAVNDGVDLVAWVSAEDDSRLLAGLEEVARRLGVADPEGDSEISAGRLRDTLAERSHPGILVLDNARKPEAVRPYLPATGAMRVIITSTDRAFAVLGTDIAVDRFDRAQSLAYLARRTDLSDHAGAEAVADELDDLPLALAQAASVIELQGLSYNVYLERLHAMPLEEMLPRQRADAYPHAVARAVLLSVEAVEEADDTALVSRALAATALLATDGVSRRVLGEILGVSDSYHRMDQALSRLVESSLAVWTADRDGIVMHRLVARAIRERLQRTGEFTARIAETTAGLQKLLVDENQAWEQLQASGELLGHAIDLWAHIVAASDRGVLTPSEFQTLPPLAHWTVRHLRATVQLSRAVDIGRAVLAASERVLGPEHPDTLTSRNNLAGVYESAGQLEEAIALYKQTLGDSERVLGPHTRHAEVAEQPRRRLRVGGQAS